jgi:hypothetical protein
VAISLGMDPNVYLDSEGVRHRVIAEAMRQAQKIRQQELEAIGIHCANALGKLFSKKRT